MSNEPTASTPGTANPSSSLLMILLLTVLAVAAGAAAMWFVTIHRPRLDAEEQTRQRLLHMTGMDMPAQNKLSDRFTDADGDMIADAPTDPSKLVDPLTLFFSYVAIEDPGEYEKLWKPFCDHLSKVTGKPVEYLPVKSSEDQLKALRDGLLHVSGYNTGSVPTAVNQCGFVPVARVPTNDPAGYHVEIIVPADSPIQSHTDLRNKKYTLTLTEPNSNSGFKAPMVLLHANYGIDPERDYLFRTSGDHRTSIDGISKHQFEAAAVASDLLAREELSGAIKKSEYRSIFKSESFPSAALGYAYNLKPELAAKVKEAIDTFDMQGTPLAEHMGPTVQTKLVPVTYKNDWSVIRRIDDACGLLRELR